MRAIGQLLVTAIISTALATCGGSNGKSQRVQIPDPPAAPVVTVDAGIKQLIFSWDAVATATHYQLLENPDGHSGFTQVGDNIPSSDLSVTRDIALHLHDWVNALYLVQACNAGGCTDSTQVSATNLMLDTIGYFKASNTGPRDSFGGVSPYHHRISVALSADGKTLAVGAYGEDSSATGINGDQADNSAGDSGVVYLFRFDGIDWYQQAYVKASNTESPDGFGTSVALSADGDTLAVGAPGERSSAIGINGDQTDNSAESAGAVYLFRFDDTDWYQQAYVKASNTDYGDYFGSSIALSTDGNTLAVGALYEESSATGINGDQDDNSAQNAGAAYLFLFDGASWAQQSYVKASNTDEYDNFGGMVALSADGATLAVSATGEDSVATGINGDQTDNSAESAGAVYLFRIDDTDWDQQSYIKASNTFIPDSYCPSRGPQPCRLTFGASVALSADGNTLVIGATGERGESSASGAAYLFRFDGVSWDQQAYVKASNPSFNANLGGSVALSADGDTLAVSALGEDSSATGINGDQADNSAGASGAVYLFRFDGASWAQQAYVKASNTDVYDSFGGTVALTADGATLAVGAVGEDSVATGINGDQTDNSAELAGAVYVY